MHPRSPRPSRRQFLQTSAATAGTLAAAGALPARDEDLARTGQWLGTVLDAIEPAADRRLVQAYATWQVMRRLRAGAAAAARPRTPTAHARNNIRAAASLLAWYASRNDGERSPGSIGDPGRTHAAWTWASPRWSARIASR